MTVVIKKKNAYNSVTRKYGHTHLGKHSAFCRAKIWIARIRDSWGLT